MVGRVFPARAGMIRYDWTCDDLPSRIPRESGDDPSGVNLVGLLDRYSPRERG